MSAAHFSIALSSVAMDDHAVELEKLWAEIGGEGMEQAMGHVVAHLAEHHAKVTEHLKRAKAWRPKK